MPLAAVRSALLAAAFLAAALLPAAGAEAAFPGRNGPLIEAVETNSDSYLGGEFARRELRAVRGMRRIFGCEEDSPPELPNTCSPRSFANPAVAPDGRTIAFEENGGLSLVGHDGTGYRRLGPFDETLDVPAFAPDGRRLVAVRHTPPTPDGRPRATVVIVRPDGTVRAVAQGFGPDWSVRNWIALIRGGQLYRVRPDGSGLRRLTRSGCWDASWAPNGLRIACTRRGGLVTMRADGSDLRLVTARLDSPTQVAWSPDGRRLAAGDRTDTVEVVDLRGRVVFRDDNGTNCSGETCWWRHGWTWGPRPQR